MLTELKIEGFKLLRDVSISPHERFNAVTGETGAGKSLLIGALKFLLGAKGGDELFAKGEDLVKVSATFDIPQNSPARENLLDENMIEPDETELHVERWKERDGRSRFFIGGRRANLPAISTIRENMIDFLEQHQASRITERSAIEILDQLGDKSHRERIEKVKSSCAEWTSLRDELREKERRIKELGDRRELVLFQLKELTDSRLEPNELDELEREHQLLAGVEELRRAAEDARILLDGDENPGIGDSIAQASKLLEPLAGIDYNWAQKLAELHSAADSIREIARELGSTIDSLNDDPQRLQEVEARISLIEKLKRKYREDFVGLIKLREKLSEDAATLDTGQEDVENLRTELAKALEKWRAQSSELSSSRMKLARRIEKELKAHLSDLGLANTRVLFSFEKNKDAEPSVKGFDKIEILLSTNPSEEPRPLDKVASGGEATRITLALKALWAEREGVPILVLDEGDIGIGGDTAYKVGEKFQELSKSHQLIVVSHLAQVASMADRHFKIEKSESGKSVIITIYEVSGDSRETELARMIGGSRDPKASIALAKSLLAGQTHRKNART